ncbi:class II aldolase/adducin family protein [Nocardia altamirensis]|uniref:class II aldolase/adducin family protein n=1 Tax=Nocardia altamirensis TaxID=472158 RepID=UPI001C3FBCD0|nr:class II aldolase/adducin family protein [Nocardia altamirensis]
MTPRNADFTLPRAAVAAAARRLAADGLVIGTAGNVSCRQGDLVAVTATGLALAAAEPEHVTVIDLNGTIIDGDWQPTSEVELHLGVYQDSEAAAVVHTHSPNAIALSLVRDELPCIHYQQLLLGGAIRVAPFAAFGTTELASSVREALRDKSAAIMANHGAVAVGPTLDAAIANVHLVEWISGIYLTAAAAGSPRALEAEQQQSVLAATLSRGYGSTVALEADRNR